MPNNKSNASSSPATNYLPFYKGQGNYLSPSSSNLEGDGNELGRFWQSLFGTMDNNSSSALDWTNFLSNLGGK